MTELVVVGLQKRYKSRQVVQSISLQVESGQVVGLLGPNGAGKTTSFYMIVGLVSADAGKIILNNKDISRLPIHQRAKMGLAYLPQEPSIFRKMTVAENILAILQLHKQSPTQEKQKLEELLEDLHITHIRDSLGISLSGGERRRVEIARCLASNPNFILLDEPFAGIDPIAVIDIQKIVRLLKERNIGVLITDHNVRETLGICDQAYIVNEGRIFASGTPSEIVENESVREVYLGKDFRL
jgi:lipopolysaccharide export system ATP-binding protein